MSMRWQRIWSLAAAVGSIVALFGCASSTSSGVRPSIAGRVVGPDGPMAEVRISTEPPTDVRLTPENGFFRIAEIVKTESDIVPGTYKLTAFKKGWKLVEQQIQYEGGDLEIEDIKMKLADPNEETAVNPDKVVEIDPAKPKRGITVSGE